MVGVGWMVVIDDWLTRGGAVGAMLGFLIGGLVLIPIGYVYGRLSERIPDAGSEIAYTGAVFPEVVSFGTGWMMTLAYLIVCPYEAVAIGRVGSYVFPQLNTIELYRVGGYPVYLPHLLAGLALTAVIVLVNYRGVHISATFQTSPRLVCLQSSRCSQRSDCFAETPRTGGRPLLTIGGRSED